MPKTKEPVYLSNRSAIAQFIGVTRMTLYRWEKIHPLPKQGILSHHYIFRIADQAIIEWLRVLRPKLTRHQYWQFPGSLNREVRHQVCDD